MKFFFTFCALMLVINVSAFNCKVVKFKDPNTGKMFEIKNIEDSPARFFFNGFKNHVKIYTGDKYEIAPIVDGLVNYKKDFTIQIQIPITQYKSVLGTMTYTRNVGTFQGKKMHKIETFEKGEPKAIFWVVEF